jgi:glucosamine 6-phosphate synthetase-like amidotransferase/phosphosugar isomerase protein
MKDCILEQGDTLRQVAEHMPLETKKVVSKIGKEFDKIYLVGSGTSLNAAYTVQYCFERCTSTEVRVVTPFEFLNYFPSSRINNRTLLLGISQTARSIGTIDSVKMARKLGAKTVFVTAEPENEGIATAHAVLNTWAGMEMVGVKTKGFTATIAALLALAHRLSDKEYNLFPLAEYADKILKIVGQAIEACIKDFIAARNVQIISYGPCMGIAKEGGLKIIETICIPAEVYDVEEYMHGPYHCLDEESRLIFLVPAGKGQERACRMLAFAEEISKHTLIIANESITTHFKNFTLLLPDGLEEDLAVIGYVIPLQWISDEVTHRLGRKPELFRYPEFHRILGSKHMPKINYYTGDET